MRLTPEAVAALERLIARWAEEEVARAENPEEAARAERAKQYWLANGLVKPSPYPSQ